VERLINGPWRQKSFTRVVWPVIWLAGLAIIITCAPAAYHEVRLEEGEMVAGFRGRSHELMLLTGGTTCSEQSGWSGQSGIRKRFLSLADRLTDPIVPATSKLPPHRHVEESTGLVLWDLDSSVRRQLPLERQGRTIHKAASCSAGNRLCIEYGTGEWAQARLVIVDAKTGKSLRTIDWLNAELGEGMTWADPRYRPPPWSINADGTTLAYCEHIGADVRTICIDVDSGGALHKFDPLDEPDTRDLLSLRSFGARNGAENVLISADGKYLAIQKQYGIPAIIDLEHHSPLQVTSPSPPAVVTGPSPNPVLLARMGAAAPQEKPKSFSRNGPFLIEADGKIRDFVADKIIWDAKAPCVFIEGGKKVAALKPSTDGSKVVCYDIEAHYELRDRPLSIPENVTSIEAVDPDGNLIRSDGTRDPVDPTWVQKGLDWLGFKQTPSRNGPHRWRLVDARSGTVLQQGWNELLAVSSDGRCVVTADNASSISVYRHPLRRSMLFIACAAIAWTLVLMLTRRVWRRRVGPYFGFQ
jgi:hypothetical protein